MAYHESLDSHGLIGGNGTTVNECGHCPAEQAALRETLAAKPPVTAKTKAFSAAGPSGSHTGIIFAERGR